MVMHLKSCCCGCSLKTGSVIIAVLAAIYALAILVVSIIGASAGTGELQKELAHEIEKHRGAFPDKNEALDKAIDQMNNTPPNKTLLAVSVCMAIVSGIYLILNILLIFGASAERPRLVKPWIVYAIMHLIVYTVLSIVNIISAFIAGAALSGTLALVIVAVFVVLEVYFILVVNSFHTELLSVNFQNKV